MPWGLFRNWTDGKDVEFWRGNQSLTVKLMMSCL